MAHALDETYGLANSMVFVGQLPWHQHGTQIPMGLSVEEAITACPAVDFETRTVQAHYFINEDDRILQKADAHRVIIRSDTGKALGVASDRYSPIQIRDQWKGLDPLIESGLATIETLGSIEGGKRTWGLVKLNPSEIPAWSELEDLVGKIEPYALTMDDKTGKRAALAAPTSVRTVCKNTLEAGIGSLTRCIRIPHVGDTAAKLDQAAEELWGDMVKSFEALAARYKLLKACQLTDAQHVELVQDVVAVVPTDSDAFSSKGRFEGAVKRAQAKRNAVRSLWIDGAGHHGDHSAWEALNGAVEALDHNAAGAFRTPKNGGKIGSMLTGTEATLKAGITRNLVGFAEEQIAA